MLAWGREQGLLAIEMEAAALYALAAVKHYPIVCFAHVTNQMAQREGDARERECQWESDHAHPH